MTDWHRHPGPDFPTFYADLCDDLRSVPDLAGGVYLGPPNDPPTDSSGRILPYVVVWPGAGVPIQDNSVAGISYGAGQQAEFTTTVVAGEMTWLLHAVRDVKARLTDGMGGRIKPNTLQQQSVVAAQSQAERPARHFIPLTWNITDHA